MHVMGRKAKRSSIEATVIRADGRIEYLGIVQFDHRNPLLRALGRAWHALKRRLALHAMSPDHRAEILRVLRNKG